jgi:hypothetical protein
MARSQRTAGSLAIDLALDPGICCLWFGAMDANAGENIRRLNVLISQLEPVNQIKSHYALDVLKELRSRLVVGAVGKKVAIDPFVFS